MKLKRAVAAGAAIVITGFSLAACGSDADGEGDGGEDSNESVDAGSGIDVSDSPSDAPVEEFCETWNDDSIGGGPDDTPDEQADSAHEAAAALAEIGSPEGLDDAGRHGFEVFVDFLANVDADDIASFAEANPSDPDAFAQVLGIDAEEADDVIAFITYAAQQCYAPSTDAPTP
jgi:hypothetical protein